MNMRKPLFLMLALALGALNCFAYDVPPKIYKRYQRIVALVKEDNAKQLAPLIKYPLTRDNLLPDIATPNEFDAYYSTIFDAVFKKKIMMYLDSYVIEHHDGYGLVGGPFSGDIWINDGGEITSINYLSPEETKLRNQAKVQIQNLMHPSVRDWEENIVTGKSKSLLIRVDRVDYAHKGIRYVSWSKGHSMSEKPDLVLFNGVQEAQGSQGGWTWTFVNGKWTYVVDDVELCGNEGCGLFLRLLFDGKETSTINLRAIKQTLLYAP